MPGTDLRLEELNMYTGACPAPKDFAKDVYKRQSLLYNFCMA